MAAAKSRKQRQLIFLGSALAIAATGLAAAIVLAAREAQPDWKTSAYEDGVEAEWDRLSSVYPDASRPNAEFVRFVSAGEADVTLSGCLAEEGVESEIDQYGVDADLGLGAQRVSLAWYVCDVRFPLDLAPGQAYAPSQQRDTYRYFGEVLTPCLEREGYEIESQPPFAEFRDRWWTDDPWSPYGSVALTDADEAEALAARCPPTPSTSAR